LAQEAEEMRQMAIKAKKKKKVAPVLKKTNVPTPAENTENFPAESIVSKSPEIKETVSDIFNLGLRQWKYLRLQKLCVCFLISFNNQANEW